MKNAKRNVIVSAFMAIALCMSVVAGATFALFTSNSSVNIAITSGNVQVTATASDLTVYSPKSVNENGIVDGKNAVAEDGGRFVNGGTATLTGGELKLDNMTPGDKASFKITVKNESGVTIKYRTRLSVIDDNGLFAALKVTIGGYEASTVGKWTTLAPSADDKNIASYDCSVELPVEAGSASIAKKCDLAFKVEAVQGNALVDYVTVEGIAGYESVKFNTIKEAYDEISPKVYAVADSFGAVAAKNAEAFDEVFTDGGKITWNIYGEQELPDKFALSFGRKFSYFGYDRDITDIVVVGHNTENFKATINLAATEGTFGIPSNWWENHPVNTQIHVSGITFDGIKSMPGHAFMQNNDNTNYVYDDCVFNGNLYTYHNYRVNISVTNSTFNAVGRIQYAMMVQGGNGAGSKVVVNNNKFYGYTRGVNFQRADTEFVFDGNEIVSAVSEPDRAAIQLTDGVSFEVANNTVNVNAGNAFWLHNAATNASATYLIKGNKITAPYVGYYGTSFVPAITWADNDFTTTDITKCMRKEATVATETNFTF